MLMAFQGKKGGSMIFSRKKYVDHQKVPHLVLLQYSTGYYGDGRYDEIVVFPDHTHTRYGSPASCSINVR